MSDRLAEIRARLDAATPGPWERRESVQGYSNLVVLADYINRDDGAWLIAEASWNGPMPDKASSGANADFIAHAPEDIAWLLGEVERLGGAEEEAFEK